MVDKSVDQGEGKSAKDEESSQDEGDTVEESASVASVVEDDEDDEEEDEEEEEPKLKYARLTSHLGAVYRNADATSTFLVAGDKMFIGTHSGNIHVISLPSFKPLRVYHAHSASISSISISPFPAPVTAAVSDSVNRVASQAQGRTPSVNSEAPSASPRTPRTPVVPKTPSNAIYIATSSIDGNVCVASLVDVKDNQLRNFARPVQAVALSPDYKNDRTYISGGQAGNLVLTVGGKSGTSSTSTTTGGAAATATGWLGTIGLGGSSGKDTILHSGEGTISTIKWSRSGKYIVWVNEHGIKLMRSNLLLDSSDTESAWKRIAHIDRPHDNGWEEMASVWKPRVDWIDEENLDTDEEDKSRATSSSSPALARVKQQAKGKKKIEKLIVGWGGTVWIVNVHPDGVGVGKHVGERSVGRAEIIKILRMDCIISGLSLYTPTLLLVLAYITPEEGEEVEEEKETKKGHKSKSSTSSEPRGGIRHRQNALSPELRLIDLNTSEEVDTYSLTVSRYERLSAIDYHLDVLPATRASLAAPTSRSTLETLSGMGSGMWNAALSATTLLSSAASVKSTGSGGSDAKKSGTSTLRGNQANDAVHPDMSAPGMRIFIHSPYDCILSTKRNLTDHLSWLLEHERYQQAWQLIDQHPEVISESPEKLAEIGPEILDSSQQKKDDFYDDVESTTDSASKLINSAVEKEKRRIGELWIQQLIKDDQWSAAGEVCGKVLNTSKQWEDWVYVFVGKDKFDEITNHIPTLQMTPPIKSEIYEVILAHYIASDRPRAKELLDVWSPILFDIGSITTVLENQLKYRDVREDSVEDGEVGRDWRIIMESLGKLHVAAGRPREALKYYIHLQDADTAMTLIKEYRLVDAVADDIPGLIMLRVSKQQEKSASIEELQEVTAEAIHLLVDEAQRGIVRTDIVVEQLEAKKMPLYLYFYLSSLWRGEGIVDTQIAVRDRLVEESRALVDDHAELTVHLFATYNRDLFMEYIKSPTFHTYEKATQECEDRSYIPELVYLYSKTGQTKRALYLIIDKLQDVSQAIAFAKDQDDTDLWTDLLDYSMDKPRFIRGLLEEVGTAINPITLVRRIPEGLEIEGLRDGLARMVREYEIQHSISLGVAKVLRGEVAVAQNALRTGQRRGVKFDVERKGSAHVDIETSSALPLPGKEILNISEADADDSSLLLLAPASRKNQKPPPPGHCIGCREAFTEHEIETLVGFACGHVFHLSHLLSFGEDEEGDGDGRPDTPPPDGVDEDGMWRATHSVGAKVTHARLLRDRIRDGCPVCRGVVVAGVE